VLSGQEPIEESKRWKEILQEVSRSAWFDAPIMAEEPLSEDRRVTAMGFLYLANAFAHRREQSEGSDRGIEGTGPQAVSAEVREGDSNHAPHSFSLGGLWVPSAISLLVAVASFFLGQGELPNLVQYLYGGVALTAAYAFISILAMGFMTAAAGVGILRKGELAPEIRADLAAGRLAASNLGRWTLARGDEINPEKLSLVPQWFQRSIVYDHETMPSHVTAVFAQIPGFKTVASMLFSKGLIPLADEGQGERPAAAEAESLLQAASIVRAYKTGELSDAEAIESIENLLNEMPTSLGVRMMGRGVGGVALDSPARLDAFAMSLGAYVSSPERLGNRALKHSLKKRGLAKGADIRHFLAETMALSGVHVYFVGEKDLEGNREYWKDLTGSLKTHFSPRQYLFITPDDSVVRGLLDLGVKPSSIRLKQDAFKSEENGGKSWVLLRNLQNVTSASGQLLTLYPALTFHASEHMQMELDGVDGILLNAARAVRIIHDALTDLPLAPSQLNMIDKVVEAVETSA
jgi:hypothetical protein